MQTTKCPNSEYWQSFLAGAIATADRSTAQSHLTGCPSCREALISLYDTQVESRMEEPAPGLLVAQVQQKPGPSRSYLPLALAASIVIAVGLSVFVFRALQSESPVFTNGEVMRSGSSTDKLVLTSPANGLQINSGQLEFRWNDQFAGTSYEFTLTDAKGDILATEKVTATSITIDTTKLRLSSTQTYYWSVVAKLPDGSSRHSAISSFTVK